MKVREGFEVLEAGEHVEHEAREAQEQVGHEAHKARQQVEHEARRARDLADPLKTSSATHFSVSKSEHMLNYETSSFESCMCILKLT